MNTETLQFYVYLKEHQAEHYKDLLSSAESHIYEDEFGRENPAADVVDANHIVDYDEDRLFFSRETLDAVEDYDVASLICDDVEGAHGYKEARATIVELSKSPRKVIMTMTLFNGKRDFKFESLRAS